MTRLETGAAAAAASSSPALYYYTANNTAAVHFIINMYICIIYLKHNGNLAINIISNSTFIDVTYLCIKFCIV